MRGEKMKKQFLIVLLIIALCITSAGCGKQITDNPEKKPVETVVDYTEKYEDILAETYYFIKNVESVDDYDEGMGGIWESAFSLGDEALDEIGYTFKDLNGDGVSELIIGAFNKEDYAYTANEIYAVYTLKNDVPALVLEGRSRSAYSLKEDGSFYYHGSNGAAYSIFGIYYINEDGEAVSNDFYFTYPDDNNPEIIGLYHNETGAYSEEDSELLDITLDEFWEKEEDISKGTAKISGTMFSELDEEIVEKAMGKSVEKQVTPDASMLDGEWVFTHGETDGYEFTAEEEGIESEITIGVSEDVVIAVYFSKTEFADDAFEAEAELLEEPVYYGCGNDEWSVKFLPFNSTFGEEDEFYATLTDENTLLLQHLYPFDGALGVSYQYYTRKY